MRWLIVRFIISAIVMAVITSGIVPFLHGVYIMGNVQTTWVAVSVIFALVNITIKPVLRFLTCPFIILTLGLLGILINVGMLYLTMAVSTALQPVTGGQLVITTFIDAVIASLIITATTIVLEWLFGTREKRRVEKVTEVRYVIEKQRPDLDAEFNQMMAAQQAAAQQAAAQQAAQYPPQQPGYVQQPQYPPQNPQYPPQPQQYPPQQQPTQYPPQNPQYPPGSFGAPPAQPPTQPPQQPRNPDDLGFDNPRFPKQK
ncbi:MAG: phage holin family protein [Anaerolineae bacterium]